MNKIVTNTFFKASLLFSILLVLTSCDQVRIKNKGNQLFGKTPYTAQKEYNIKEIPEGYAEVVTDTILKNDFVVKIKFHSTEDKVYTIENNINNLHKTAYKEFQSDVFVYYNDELVLEKRVEKGLFKEADNKFWNKCIMQSIQLNEIASLRNNVVFSISFFNPSLNKYQDYELVVDRLGDYYIQEVEAV